MTGFILTTALAVSSQVTDVTVFNDRAQVVRTAEVELKDGLNTVRFEDLPAGVDSRGIQVDGTGPATVMDVRYKTENFKEVPQETWQALYEQEEELQEEHKAVAQKRDAVNASKSFLLKISSKVTATVSKEGAEQLDPERWEKMLDMYLDQQLEYDADIREADLEIKAIEKKLEKVRADIRTMGASRNRQRQVVEVDVDMAKAGSVMLKLSYLVQGPTWVPAYDVRGDTELRKMEVKSFALIRQNTGEDWKNVTLKLSTASPGLGGQHATLQPWRLKVKEQVAKGTWYQDSDAYSVGYNAFEPMDNRINVRNDAPTPAAEAPAVVERSADISQQGTAVVFTPEGLSTVESDNVEHRIAVSSAVLPSHFRYSAVPKLDSHAYLKAKVKNSSGHPFLAGRANIFLDGSYVTTSDLELVPPEEEFWVFLGVDAGMTVEYRQLKEFESSEGRKGRNTRRTYEYLAVVKNTHDKPEEFIVWNQIPISENEEIEVKLLEPKYSKDSQALKMDGSKRLQWFKVLQPGEKWKIPFRYQVEAPADMKVEGL